MNNVDIIRQTVYELSDDKYRLNYLTMMLEIYNANPLFDEKERQRNIEELLSVQREVVNIMFMSGNKNAYYQEKLRKLVESYE